MTTTANTTKLHRIDATPHTTWLIVEIMTAEGLVGIGECSDSALYDNVPSEVAALFGILTGVELTTNWGTGLRRFELTIDPMDGASTTEIFRGGEGQCTRRAASNAFRSPHGAAFSTPFRETNNPLRQDGVPQAWTDAVKAVEDAVTEQEVQAAADEMNRVLIDEARKWYEVPDTGKHRAPCKRGGFRNGWTEPGRPARWKGRGSFS